MTEKQQNFSDLIPVSKWNEKFSYPTVGSIRQLIFYNTDNFNERVIRKIGNRLYIKVSEFWAWVEETNNKSIA